MFAVCRDLRKNKLIVIIAKTAKKYDYLEVVETTTTYGQAQRMKEELLGKSSSRLCDIVKEKGR